MRECNARERRFVEEYLISLDARDAAIKAGYTATTANKISYQILRRPHIQSMIKADTEKRAERMAIKADRVLEELARVAFLDLTGIIKVENGRVRITDHARLTEAQRAALSEISLTDSGIRIKAHDKMKALELLGRHLGMFLDKVEHSGRLDITERLSDEDLERIAAGQGGEGTDPAPQSTPQPA